MNFITRSWRGEERLWKVYWLYGVLGGTGLNILINIILLLKSLALDLIGVCLLLTYILWLTVSQWRCAFNVDARFWGYLVRGLVLLSILCLVLGLIAGGILVGGNIALGAKCQQEMNEHTARGEIISDREDYQQKCIVRLKAKETIPETGEH